MNLIATNSLNLGAPILDSTVNQESVVSDGKVVYPGYSPIIITPTITNGGKQSTDGNTNNNGQSSSNSDSSSSSSSTSTTTYDVKTGTTKKWTDNSGSRGNYNPFEDVKVLNEEQRKQGQAVLEREVQEQKSVIEAKYAQQRAILELQKVKAEEREKMMRVVLITVIGAVLIGITIFGMLRVVKYFSPPERLDIEKPSYDEVNNTETKTRPSQYEIQFDANKEFVAVYDAGGKLKQEQHNQDQLDVELTAQKLNQEKEKGMIDLKKAGKEPKQGLAKITYEKSSINSSAQELEADGSAQSRKNFVPTSGETQ